MAAEHCDEDRAEREAKSCGERSARRPVGAVTHGHGNLADAIARPPGRDEDLEGVAEIVPRKMLGKLSQEGLPDDAEA